MVHFIMHIGLLWDWKLTYRAFILFLRVFLTLQAGAKHVYAVEASEMAEYARKLIAGNPFLAARITVTYLYLLFTMSTTFF